MESGSFKYRVLASINATGDTHKNKNKRCPEQKILTLFTKNTYGNKPETNYSSQIFIRHVTITENNLKGLESFLFKVDFLIEKLCVAVVKHYMLNIS